MMKKLIIVSGVFASVVASVLGEICSHCGNEMAVSSRERGMCIDCYRCYELGRPRCKDCGRSLESAVAHTGLCMNCFQIKRGHPKCSKCGEKAAFLCLCRCCVGSEPMCRLCKDNAIWSKDSQDLCLACWEDSKYSVCPRCNSGQLMFPSRPMCKVCWEKDGPLCKKCGKERPCWGNDLCDRCYYEEKGTAFGCGCD